MLDPDARNPVPPKVTLDKYPSGAPSKIVQVRTDAAGGYIPNGIWTEWYVNGELKRFIDYAKGEPHGIEITCSPNGEILSRIEYRHGKRIRTVRGNASGNR